MSFQQGLSGLSTMSKSLEVIGNNVANANTYGAKASRAEFADLYASSLSASSLSGGGGNNVGIGVTVAAVTQQFSQGLAVNTENPLDLSINGNGFFQMASADGGVNFTRNGQFKIDKDGFIVNNNRDKLMGYSADSAGTIQPGKSVALQIPTAGIKPAATSEIVFELNLDSRLAATAPAPTAVPQT